MSEPRKLYRASEGRLLGGVCAGLGQYMGIDPLLVRLMFVVLGFVNGLGVVIYLAMWIIIPDQANRGLSSEDSVKANIDDMTSRITGAARSVGEGRGMSLVGFALILFGGLFLLRQFIPEINFNLFWPALLILGGLYLLARRR
jgi:phage shock protein C